jgi:molybdopterin converting factor small subunit
MITVHVQAFGILKDFIGSSEMQWKLREGITAEEIRSHIRSHYLVHPELPIAVVRDNRYLEDATGIQNEDHLFLMPPVSGG